MANIVVYTRDENNKVKDVLLGKESRYVSDLFEGNFKTNFSDTYETYFPIQHIDKSITDPIKIKKLIEEISSIEYAKKRFKRLIEKLETEKNDFIETIKANNISPIIRFDTPTEHTREKSGLKYYKTNLRYLPEKYKYGIPKGGIEGNEQPIDAAIREIKEEVLDQKDLEKKFFAEPNKEKNKKTNSGRSVFFLKYEPKPKTKTVKDYIEENTQNRYGEIYDLKFVPIKEVLEIANNNQKMNYQSIQSINIFEDEKINSQPTPTVKPTTQPKPEVFFMNSAKRNPASFSSDSSQPNPAKRQHSAGNKKKTKRLSRHRHRSFRTRKSSNK